MAVMWAEAAVASKPTGRGWLNETALSAAALTQICRSVLVESAFAAADDSGL